MTKPPKTVLKGGRAHTHTLIAYSLILLVLGVFVALVVLVDETARLEVVVSGLIDVIDSRVMWVAVGAALGQHITNWIDSVKDGRGKIERAGGPGNGGGG